MGFGVLAGLAVLSFASPHAAQQRRVVQLNNLKKVFICLQVVAAKPNAPLGQAEAKTKGSTLAPRVDSDAPPESSSGNSQRAAPAGVTPTSLGPGAQGGTRGRVRSPACWPARVRGSVLEYGSLHRFPQRSMYETAADRAAVASWHLDGAVEARWLFRVVLQVKPIDFLIRSHSSHVPPPYRLGKILRKLDVIRCPRFPIDDDHNILG